MLIIAITFNSLIAAASYSIPTFKYFHNHFLESQNQKCFIYATSPSKFPGYRFLRNNSDTFLQIGGYKTNYGSSDYVHFVQWNVLSI